MAGTAIHLQKTPLKQGMKPPGLGVIDITSTPW
jgi:hypothetical protein